MKTQNLLSMLVIITVLNACTKGEGTDKMSIEGVVRDQYNGQPVAGVRLYADAVKSGSGGVGLLSNGKAEFAGSAVTNSSGYYKLNLKVFKSADRLTIGVNDGPEKAGYSGFVSYPDLSSFDRHGKNTKDYLLGPTATLKIKFKNTSPVAATDTFHFFWYTKYSDITKHILGISSCGTVPQRNDNYWIGQDACGEYTIDAMAEVKYIIAWNVRKNGGQRQYTDSVLVRRNLVTEYAINY